MQNILFVVEVESNTLGHRWGKPFIRIDTLLRILQKLPSSLNISLQSSRIAVVELINLLFKLRPFLLRGSLVPLGNVILAKSNKLIDKCVSHLLIYLNDRL